MVLQGSDPNVGSTHDAVHENYPPSFAVTHHDPLPRRKRLFRWLQKAWPWLAAVILVLIGIRMALPYALTWQMNRVLSAPGPYQGHVDGMTLDLWRGAYQVHSIAITVTRDDGQPKPLFSADLVKISLDWSQLLKGRIRSSIILERPRLIIAPSGPATGNLASNDVAMPTPPAEKASSQAQKPPRERWQDRVSSVIAFRIDELRINDGLMQYYDEGRGVDLGIDHIGGEILGIAGGKASKPELATFDLNGGTTGGGSLHLTGRADPWALAPTFDVLAEIKGLHLVGLNASSKHLNGLTFRKGVFSANAEVHAADGELVGYVKPLFIDLDVATYGTNQDNIAKTLFWKAAIVVAENLLPNDDTNALAARIPIIGRFDDPETDTWTIIGSVLGNAFLSAILPGFEGMTQFTTTPETTKLGKGSSP